jgi:hypothetical protein
MSKRSFRWFVLVAVLAALACSFIVDTDEIVEGCGSGKKLCAGVCVDIGDPAYGCLPNVCEPCRRDHGIPRCGANDCEYETCLYGWGCSDCRRQILSDPEHCGGCNKSCDGGTCRCGLCVDSIDAGAGGQAGDCPWDAG